MKNSDPFTQDEASFRPSSLATTHHLASIENAELASADNPEEPSADLSSPGKVNAVYMLDADERQLSLATEILRTLACQLVPFMDPIRFLAEFDGERANCLVLNDRLPNMMGLEVVRQLQQRGVPPAFVVVSARPSTRGTVAYMRAGAVNVLEQPLDPQELIDSVSSAFELDQVQRTQAQYRSKLCSRIAELTPRELQILRMVLNGSKSKQIAQDLAIASKTVDVHRSNIVRKLQIESFSELIYDLLNEQTGSSDRAKRLFDDLLRQHPCASRETWSAPTT